MQISTGFVCDFKNKNFIELLFSLRLLLDYSIFLSERNNHKEVFSFYNYVFEKYLPEAFNLSNVNYDELFICEFKDPFREIYKKLVELWIDLQEKWSFDVAQVDLMKKLLKQIIKITEDYQNIK
jgi:hypothetical protein